MLRNVKDLQGYAIRATDGVIGEVDDFYFDDEDWAIRYLIVDTGTWLSGRKVLISPLAIGHPDWLGQLLPVSLTKVQVEKSPDIDTRKPVSRQQEAEYFGYYGYPYYWEGVGVWGLDSYLSGMGAYPGGVTTEPPFEEDMRTRRAAAKQAPGDCHLRSCRAVIGYQIHATDGDIGRVGDFLVDEHTWKIRFLAVDTSNAWGGHQGLIAPPWIEAVDWSTETVSVDLTRHAIKAAPPYDPVAQFTREQEQALYEHYGRTGYWTIKAPHDGTVPAVK